MGAQEKNHFPPVPDGRGVVIRTKSMACGAHAASRCCMETPFHAAMHEGGLFMMQKNREKEMVILGILTALSVLLSYVFAIQTPFVRITFGFLPIALAGALYGPWKAGMVGALDNLIGTALVGTSIFFPGFTLSDFLTGFIFGYFFYGRKISFPYVCVPFLVIMVLIHLGLNTLWLVLYYDKAASAIFMSRLIKNLICFPMEVGLFMLLYRKMYDRISFPAVGKKAALSEDRK